ncbi:MAG: putative cobalamin biosynthesis protein [Verrucomicrobiaceae bacterium]|nr:putative cobalamin biosynthesis protein [Verrucomicrobiaceae bacterium]
MSTATYFVGIGCRRDCPEKSLRKVLQQALSACGITIEQIEGLASIDTKKDEAGLLELAQSLTIPLSFFPAEHLNTFSNRVSDPSANVLETTGTQSVAEASALALALALADTRGELPKLIVNKLKNSDATCAVARINLSVKRDPA